jgi:hypothetical protein
MMDAIAIVAAVIVGTLSVARLTRLVTQDTFPPIAALRMKWDDLTEGSGWNTLFHCHWCMAPWLTLPIGAWGYLSGLHTSWWLFNGWLAAAYVAGMIVERDEVE